MPISIGSASKMAEIAFTGRNFNGAEAKEIGFVSDCLGTREQMEEYVMAMARRISSMTPVVIYGIKRVLRSQRITKVERGLE